MVRRPGTRVLFIMGLSGMFVIGLATAASAASNDISVEGQVVYEDGSGNPHAIQGATVKVCEDDGLLGVLCVQTVSGADGFFSVALHDPSEDDQLSEVFVEVTANSVGVKVTPDLIPFSYCFRVGVFSVEDGETLDIGQRKPLGSAACTWPHGTLTDARENAGFYVFTQLHRAYLFMDSVTRTVNGRSIPKVNAGLVAADDNPADDGVSFYALGNIVVKPNTWDTDSDYGHMTIFHEYGHHVLANFAVSPLPFYDNGNCDGATDFLLFEITDPGHCAWLRENGVIAWTEGFPTFLSAVLDHEIYGRNRVAHRPTVPEYDGVTYQDKGTERPAMRRDTADGSEVILLNGGDGLFEDHPDTAYRMIEGFTSAVLWDVYDDNVDDHDKDHARDTFSMSFEQIWTVVTRYDPEPSDPDHNYPTSLAEFYDGVIAKYPDVKEALLAGPFLENHITEPAAAMTLVRTGSLQGWNSFDIFGRGDAITSSYEVCRPTGSTVPWEGEVELAIVLLQTSTGKRIRTMTTIDLADAGAGDCSTGTYEVQVPNDWEFIGPKYLYGAMQDRWNVTDTVVCVDPHYQIAEHDETNNCGNSHPLRLQNRSPIVMTNATTGGFVVAEGSNLVIDFTGSYDPDPIAGQGLQYGIGADIIVSYFEGLVINEFTPEDLALLADDHVGQVLMKVRDDGDVEFSSEMVEFVPLVVENVSPIPVVTNTPSMGRFVIFEGSTLHVEGQFRDPGDDEWFVEAFFDGDSGWSSGVITEIDRSVSISPPANVGYFEIDKYFANQTSGKGTDFLVCAEDDDGGRVCTENLVQVINVKPSVELPPSLDIDEGSSTTLNGSFTDPGEDLWTATVSVDGGGPVPLALDTVSKTFAVPVSFQQDGVHNVNVCVHDGDGEGCASTEVTVANVAPAFSLGADRDINEGDSVSLLRTFTDPGNDAWTATVSFDGGTAISLALTGKTFTVGKDYPQEGGHSILVCVSDDDTETCDAIGITVHNVPPAVTIDSAPEIVPVLVDNGVSVTFTDPGSSDDHTATIDWGDGTVDTLGTTDTASGSFSRSHAYSEVRDVTIQVCVDDGTDESCVETDVRVVSVTEAINATIADLAEAALWDDEVATALAKLQGSTTQSMSGALTKLEDGDFVAAVTKLHDAIEVLGESSLDTLTAQRLLTLVSESIARDLHDQVLSLGLTSRGDLRQLRALDHALADGRAAYEDGNYGDAIDRYKRAVRRAVDLLS